MSGGSTRPIAHFDPAWGARVAEFCADAYAQHAAEKPASVGQTGYALAADVALDCGLVRYAFGATPEEVRVWIARAAHALGEVFRLRGAAPSVRSVVLSGDDTSLQATASESVDHSLTNPGRGLLAMYTALVAGDRSLAEQTATLLCDTPDPDPAEPSAIGTADERRLARALLALLLGQEAVAASDADSLADAPPSLGAQGAALAALARRDKAAFLEALRCLLVVHAAEAADEDNAREPRVLLCLPGLALSALALASGLLQADELPEGDVYLPVEVLRRSPGTGRAVAHS